MARLVTSLLLCMLSALISPGRAQSNDTVSVFKPEDTYSYHGCYNETTEIPNSDGSRALSGGITEVREDEMTVPLCLDLCSEGNQEYVYAGLQWSRYDDVKKLVYASTKQEVGNAGAQTR